MRAWLRLVTSLLFATTVAHAQNESLAEALFRDGRADMKAEKYEAACPKFAESYRLDPSTGTLFNLARCEEKLGHLATAWTKYQRLLDTAPPGDERRAIARERVAAFQEKIPKLTIVLRPRERSHDVTVTLDGVTLGEATLGVEMPVDPGKHSIAFDSRDASGARSVELAPGDHQRVELDVGAAPAKPNIPPKPEASEAAPKAALEKSPLPTDARTSPGKSLRIAGYTSGAIGLAGLVGAGVLTAVALGQKSTVDSQCTGTECDAEGLAAAERGRSLLRLADAALVTGIVGVAVGGFLIWQSSKVDVRANVDSHSISASARLVLP